MGIRGDRIVRVSAEPLAGTRVIDAKGLVVAPGLIDLHQHQQDADAYRLKALDGVSTALELEAGVPDVGRFLDARRGRTPIHFGATVSHQAARLKAWDQPVPASPFGEAAGIIASSGPGTNEPASGERLERIRATLRAGLDAGALGVGIGLQYTPGATRYEVVEVFRVAARYRRPVFVHVRSSGRLEPGSGVESVLEVIAAAAVTGAAGHVVHVNSSCLQDAPTCVALVNGAAQHGVDVTTEAYPYGVAMTSITSAFFDAGWREKLGIGDGDLELPETGERLTRKRFDELHASPIARMVLIHVNPDSIVDEVIRQPAVMIASDGLREHPRGAGTFARVLAHVRDGNRGVTLMEAINKLSLMPAQRLEAATSDARRKGRLQEGADADIVIFDPARVQDRATYAKPGEPSVGVQELIVAGTIVVDMGRLVDGVTPGRALLAGRAAGQD